MLPLLKRGDLQGPRLALVAGTGAVAVLLFFLYAAALFADARFGELTVSGLLMFAEAFAKCTLCGFGAHAVLSMFLGQEGAVLRVQFFIQAGVVVYAAAMILTAAGLLFAGQQLALTCLILQPWYLALALLAAFVLLTAAIRGRPALLAGQVRSAH